jgi:hypothetical protein
MRSSNGRGVIRGMTESQERLRQPYPQARIGSWSPCSAWAGHDRVSHLDAKTHALVRLAALLALEAS